MKEYIFQAKYQETMSYFDSHKLPELIRCKDCKYRFDDCCYNRKSIRIEYGIHVEDNWFCADAEKKEGVTDGR